ncbi:MAG: hypothetical protein WCT19_03425 [Candidatus Paceibacterota bacterium]
MKKIRLFFWVARVKWSTFKSNIHSRMLRLKIRFIDEMWIPENELHPSLFSNCEAEITMSVERSILYHKVLVERRSFANEGRASFKSWDNWRWWMETRKRIYASSSRKDKSEDRSIQGITRDTERLLNKHFSD